MNCIKSMLFTTAACTLALASTVVTAHGDEPKNAPNGGQLREAGAYHFELVMAKDATEAKESAVVVFVTDRNSAKVSTVDATGSATILVGKTKTTAALVADGDNRLKGAAKYLSSPDMKVVLSITLAGKSAEQARFTPFTVAKDGHTSHKH